MGGITIVVGGWSNSPGVKLFSGIVGGGVVPIGATVMSGVTILIIVPGVVAGIVELFEGMKLIGSNKSVGRAPGVSSTIDPIPEIASVIITLALSGILDPVPIRFTGPKQTWPES